MAWVFFAGAPSWTKSILIIIQMVKIIAIVAPVITMFSVSIFFIGSLAIVISSKKKIIADIAISVS